MSRPHAIAAPRRGPSARGTAARLLLAGLACAALLAAAAAHPLPARAAVNTAPPASPVKLDLHPPLHRTGLARRRPRRPRRRPARQQLLRQRHQLRLGARRHRRQHRHRPLVDVVPQRRRRRLPSRPSTRRATSTRATRASRPTPAVPTRSCMFKSCFPNSQLSGPSAPVPAIADNPMKGQSCGGGDFTVANAKGIYLDLLPYFGAHPEKLFVAVVAPPVTSPDTPGGRALADWLVDHWLQDSGYTAGNVLVFDFYNVLTQQDRRRRQRRRPRERQPPPRLERRRAAQDGRRRRPARLPERRRRQPPERRRRPEGHGRVRAAAQRRLQRLEGQRRRRRDTVGPKTFATRTAVRAARAGRRRCTTG